MESFNKKICDNYKLVKELPNDSKELPKFLANCKTLYKTVDPQDEDQIKIVIEFLKQKLNSVIFLSFQDREFKTLEEFQLALKNHYLRKVPSFEFYFMSYISR